MTEVDYRFEHIPDGHQRADQFANAKVGVQVLKIGLKLGHESSEEGNGFGQFEEAPRARD
ncbi:hypothetical protein AB7828_30140 [Tardiphaga sp. 215_C5_N2_1]|uniref:hypothetical protein n=1 Tax=Tardiphaga sp. 215_C5_N2_1 TaxID=3240774 RepID=UPI003F8A57C0